MPDLLSLYQLIEQDRLEIVDEEGCTYVVDTITRVLNSGTVTIQISRKNK